jgi:hypothetical protein
MIPISRSGCSDLPQKSGSPDLAFEDPGLVAGPAPLRAGKDANDKDTHPDQLSRVSVGF